MSVKNWMVCYFQNRRILGPVYNNEKENWRILILSIPIFLPPTYSPTHIYFGWERGWWIICNYPTVKKEKNRNRTERVQPALSGG
jgi:hypothetical protein